MSSLDDEDRFGPVDAPLAPLYESLQRRAAVWKRAGIGEGWHWRGIGAALAAANADTLLRLSK